MTLDEILGRLGTLEEVLGRVGALPDEDRGGSNSRRLEASNCRYFFSNFGPQMHARRPGGAFARRSILGSKAAAPLRCRRIRNCEPIWRPTYSVGPRGVVIESRTNCASALPARPARAMRW